MFFAVFFFFLNIYSFFYKVLYIKVNIQKQPHQLCASVILAGGLTVYKEDFIQRNLSQRRPCQ